MANKKQSSYIKDQLLKNRVTNNLKKENSTLQKENAMYKNVLRRLGYDV
mgnify:CR=1 FL=1|jgi:hypothetical protein